MRRNLDAFAGKDPNGIWAWFVQNARKASRQDFEILMKQRGGAVADAYQCESQLADWSLRECPRFLGRLRPIRGTRLSAAAGSS
jgi:hypothetical protein